MKEIWATRGEWAVGDRDLKNFKNGKYDFERSRNPDNFEAYLENIQRRQEAWTKLENSENPIDEE